MRPLIFVLFYSEFGDESLDLSYVADIYFAVAVSVGAGEGCFVRKIEQGRAVLSRELGEMPLEQGGVVDGDLTVVVNVAHKDHHGRLLRGGRDDC